MASPEKKAGAEAEQEAIAHAIQQLSPAEAELFLHKLERAVVRRRIQLWGYLTALVAWAVVMFFSLAAYGGADPHSFRAWLLALPFVAIGVVLYVFGWLADRAHKAPPKTSLRAAEAAAPAAPATSPKERPSAPTSSDTGREAGKRR